MFVYVLDVLGLFDWFGNFYVDVVGIVYVDNYCCFVLFGLVVVWLVEGVDVVWWFDIVYVYDWYVGLVCVYVVVSCLCCCIEVKMVFIIYNLVYQGLFLVELFCEFGLLLIYYVVEGLEFYGQVSFMKVGLYFVEVIMMVSFSYVCEIQMFEQGCGFDGLLCYCVGVLYGVLNGVDYGVWLFVQDIVIVVCYSVDDVVGKVVCKVVLQCECGLVV